MFPVSLDCQFLIAPLVFSNIYLLSNQLSGLRKFTSDKYYRQSTEELFKTWVSTDVLKICFVDDVYIIFFFNVSQKIMTYFVFYNEYEDIKFELW